MNSLKLKLANGNIYEGEVYNNLPNGYGIEYTEFDGIAYEGYWAGGNYHGEGKKFSKDFGDVTYYVGTYSNGSILDTEIVCFNSNDQELGRELFKNGCIISSNIKYNNGQQYTYGAFTFDRNSEVTSIYCKCGKHAKNFEKTSESGFFSNEKYRINCEHCGNSYSNISKNSFVK